MKPRELFLLSPYQYPSSTSLSLADEDMASWMNAYTALWHPAALWGAVGPPRVDVPYDYEEPQAHHVYAVPESPPLVMAEDWEERVRAAGAVLIEATTDREETLKQAKEVFAQMAPADLPGPPEPQSEGGEEQSSEYNDAEGEAPPESKPAKSEEQSAEPDVPATTEEPAPQLSPEEIHAKLLALEPEQVRPFYAIGLGYLLQQVLAEGMEHENLLEAEDFWRDVQNAIAALVGLATEPPDVPGTGGNDYGYYGGPADYDSAGNNPSDYQDPENYPEEPLYDDSAAYSQEQQEDYPGSDYPEGGEYEDYNSNDDMGVPRVGRYLLDPATSEPWLAHLFSAAQRILSAREVLYPVTIYLLDLFLPDAEKPAEAWPASLHRHIPLNVLAPASLLETLQKDHAELFQKLREGVDNEEIEVCGGCYLEREDNLLPVESQLWNLVKGQKTSTELLGRRVDIFARRRFYGHPQMPLFLSSSGFNRALLLPSEESAMPQYHSTVVSWPSPDGKQVDAFVRAPYQANRIETLFNLGHYLFKTIREDHSATICLQHGGDKPQPWYEDFLELSRFGPIFGEWITFSRYFNEVMAGEYTEVQSADDFHFDYLSERAGDGDPNEPPPSDIPVSGFARHVRLRRLLDTCWSLAAMQRGLVGRNDPLQLESQLSEIEDRIEKSAPNGSEDAVAIEKELGTIEQQILAAMADRLQARATSEEPGYLIINPCTFARRVALEVDRPQFALPLEDPVKACQLDEDKMRLVVELPSLGFAWIPRSGPAGTPAPAMRMRLADDRHVRNEFFEAEIDPKTGGLFSIADRRNPFSRLAQRLVFNPGSNMKAESIKATSVGPALGEVVSEGTIVGEQDQVLAKFRQRFRAWLGRPVLEMRIEIFPEQPAAGYPWHAYYGCRFAWADERSMLLRGVNGTGYMTHHTRPQTPDFLEVRTHRLGTVIFPAGLPFVQRHDQRMLDIILMPQGETANTFDLAVALDREYPMQTALGLTTPVSMIATSKGPPHIGAKGWLYHLDTPNLLLTSMRPGGVEIPDPFASEEEQEKRDLRDAITLRLLEIASHSGHAEFRCVRDPQRAATLDARGERLLELSVSGDSIFLEVTPGDFNQVQIEFG